jgi:hypothetical protein
MKTFLVHLRDREPQRIQAESYRRSGDQYVFDSGSAEVFWFLAEEVIGIQEAPVMHPQIVKMKPSARSRTPL